MAFGAALPTIASLAYYMATGDPTVRPLGISKEALERFIPAVSADADIQVTILWGSDSRFPRSQDDVIAIIGRSLDAYDVAYRFQFIDTAGDEVRLTYQVRDSRIGPFPISRAAAGIPAAVSAVRMIEAAEAVPADGRGWTWLATP